MKKFSKIFETSFRNFDIFLGGGGGFWDFFEIMGSFRDFEIFSGFSAILGLFAGFSDFFGPFSGKSSEILGIFLDFRLFFETLGLILGLRDFFATFRKFCRRFFQVGYPSDFST